MANMKFILTENPVGAYFKYDIFRNPPVQTVSVNGCRPTEIANSVKDVKVFKDAHTGDDKVVMVTFTDGTMQKSVTSEGDTFNLETGITICLMKRLLSGGEKSGTYEYNKAIRNCTRIMKENEKAAEKAKKEAEEKKRIAIHRREKAARKRKEKYARGHRAEISPHDDFKNNSN